MFILRTLLCSLFLLLSLSNKAETDTHIFDFSIFLNTVDSEYSVLFGESIPLSVVSNRPFDGDETWVWSDPDHLSCLDCPNPIYNPTKNTVLTVTVTDGDGCVATSEITLEIVLLDDIYIPTAFSPNWDGANDRFTVYAGPGIVIIDQIEIFTRKGDLVFLANNILPNEPNSSWDGTFNGETLNPGRYTYLLTVEVIDGSTKQLAGTVNLVR